VLVSQAVELTQQIGRHITMVTKGTDETAALVYGSPEGECGLLPKYLLTE